MKVCSPSCLWFRWSSLTTTLLSRSQCLEAGFGFLKSCLFTRYWSLCCPSPLHTLRLSRWMSELLWLAARTIVNNKAHAFSWSTERVAGTHLVCKAIGGVRGKSGKQDDGDSASKAFYRSPPWQELLRRQLSTLQVEWGHSLRKSLTFFGKERDIKKTGIKPTPWDCDLKDLLSLVFLLLT